MAPSFLQAYLEAFHDIEGWFQFDAALLFMAYCQLLRDRGIAGNVLEIGVHHGLSAIAVASLRGPGKSMYAVDLFEKLQDQNVSGSGAGNRAIFVRNMGRFYPDAGFLRILARSSAGLTARDLGQHFSFCHVDGGHSRKETCDDLRLCSSILMPGGIVALDDYFNPEYPGVSEGAAQFMLESPGTLAAVAIGYGKVLFQRLPAPFDLNAAFERRFGIVSHKTVRVWDAPAFLMTSVFRSHFDLYASTPERFVRIGEIDPRATFAPECPDLAMIPGETKVVRVVLANTSAETFPSGAGVLGLSYHLRSATGELLQHDNDRSWITTPLAPGSSATVPLSIKAPDRPGRYLAEIDLVWEQVMWFGDVGNPTARVTLSVHG